MKKRFLISIASMALASSLVLGGCKVEPPEPDPSSASLASDPASSKDAQPVRQNYAFDAKDTSVFIYRNGQLISLEVDEGFDKEYYDVAEFRKEMVEPAITGYNKSQGAAEAVTGDVPVVLDDLSLNGAKLSLKISYKSIKDYLQFNKSFNEFFAGWNVFTVCKVSDIAANGIDITGAFVDLKGNAISSSKIKETCGDYYVCAINFGGAVPSGVSGTFVFEGDIAYLSNGLATDSENSVTLRAGENIQYIIFY